MLNPPFLLSWTFGTTPKRIDCFPTASDKGIEGPPPTCQSSFLPSTSNHEVAYFFSTEGYPKSRYGKQYLCSYGHILESPNFYD